MRPPALVALCLAVSACATAAARAGDGATAPAAAADTVGLVPAGYGTLHQDAFTVELRAGTLLLKATPLAEEVIRLAAPDTYHRLNALATSRRRPASGVGGETTLLLVSLYSYASGVAYEPEDLELVQQGRVYRPLRITALTAGWGRQRLNQRELESAIYAFIGRVDYDVPFTLRYGAAASDAWRDIIPALQAERARVRSRAPSSPQASMPYSLILR